MLPVRLQPVALAELTDAWRWYEAERGGLGDEFRTCVERIPEFEPRQSQK